MRVFALFLFLLKVILGYNQIDYNTIIEFENDKKKYSTSHHFLTQNNQYNFGLKEYSTLFRVKKGENKIDSAIDFLEPGMALYQYVESKDGFGFIIGEALPKKNLNLAYIKISQDLEINFKKTLASIDISSLEYKILINEQTKGFSILTKAIDKFISNNLPKENIIGFSTFTNDGLVKSSGKLILEDNLSFESGHNDKLILFADDLLLLKEPISYYSKQNTLNSLKVKVYDLKNEREHFRLSIDPPDSLNLFYPKIHVLNDTIVIYTPIAKLKSASKGKWPKGYEGIWVQKIDSKTVNVVSDNKVFFSKIFFENLNYTNPFHPMTLYPNNWTEEEKGTFLPYWIKPKIFKEFGNYMVCVLELVRTTNRGLDRDVDYSRNAEVTFSSNNSSPGTTYYGTFSFILIDKNTNKLIEGPFLLKWASVESNSYLFRNAENIQILAKDSTLYFAFHTNRLFPNNNPKESTKTEHCAIDDFQCIGYNLNNHGLTFLDNSMIDAKNQKQININACEIMVFNNSMFMGTGVSSVNNKNKKFVWIEINP